MAHERKCIVCGKEYTYCPKCGGKDDPNEVWRTIYCSSNCMSVSKIWDKYRASKLTLDDAKEMLSKYEVLPLEQYADYMQPVMKDLVTSSDTNTIKDKVDTIETNAEVTTLEDNATVETETVEVTEEVVAPSRTRRKNRKTVIS